MRWDDPYTRSSSPGPGPGHDRLGPGGVRGYTPPGRKGSFKEENTVRDDQSVAGMANEVLLRQAKARADRSGEPIEAAMEAVVGTEAGKQLVALRDGPHADEGIEEWQVGIARERARERTEALGGRLEEEVPERSTHG